MVTYTLSSCNQECTAFLSDDTGSIKLRSLHQGVRIWNFEEKTKQKNKKSLRQCFWLNEECPKLLSSLGIDHRRRKTIPLRNSLGKKKSSSGHHCMSGIYIIGHYVMTWSISNCEQGSGSCLFLQTQHQNVSYGREAGRTDPYGPQEMATQAHQASHRHCLCFALSCRFTGCRPLNFLYLINLKFWVRAPNGCCIL